MVNYSVFDESFYLRAYPDVNAAVNSPRGFITGLEHFDLFGRREGRSVISPYYDEAGYLSRNPDVAAAVAAGAFTSGAQHFVEFGYDERRVSPIEIFNSEEIYLQKYPDVAAAVASGAYRSGYQHFLEAGRFEGRSPTYFDEQDYLLFNPDVAAAVANPNDDIVSGFDHFLRFGQFEDRLPFFVGTPGNDIIQGFGITRSLYGVALESTSGEPFDYRLLSTGVGEIDTLIGSPGREAFALAGGISPSNPTATQFYVGRGAGDYAIIRSFERGIDVLELAGASNEYRQVASGGNLSIFRGTDLVAVVEGQTTPLGPIDARDFNPIGGTFFIS